MRQRPPLVIVDKVEVETRMRARGSFLVLSVTLSQIYLRTRSAQSDGGRDHSRYESGAAGPNRQLAETSPRLNLACNTRKTADEPLGHIIFGDQLRLALINSAGRRPAVR